MINWLNEKEKLQQWINDGVTYEEIGRKYGCSGENIRKQAKKLGLVMPKRRHINPLETFNKGTGKKCMNCGKPIGKRNSNYCSNECRQEFVYNKLVKEWKENKTDGGEIDGSPRTFVRRYMLEKFNYSCERCGFNKKNEYTGNTILQLHHKDGDCKNNNEENLELLCPNCHALTENFGSRNKNSTRIDRRTKYYKISREKKNKDN